MIDLGFLCQVPPYPDEKFIMKKGNSHKESLVAGTSSGGIFLLLGFAVLAGFGFYWIQGRIHELHRELFNADAPLSYELDFDNMQLITKARITSQPRENLTKWKEFPFMTQPLVYRITHRVGVGTHKGQIDLKVADNGINSVFLNSDVSIFFHTSGRDVDFSVAPFEYAARDFRLHFGEVSGRYHASGLLKLRINKVNLKMVNYLFELSDLVVEIPTDINSINVLASKVSFDEAKLDHSKIVFSGSDPLEIKLQSTFGGQPIEAQWSIHKTKVQEQDVHVGTGKLSFPTALLSAYVEPKINRQLISEEEKVKNSGSEKQRFLFSALKDVRRAEAIALTLRSLTNFKNIRREGDFYHISIDKEVALQEGETNNASDSALVQVQRCLELTPANEKCLSQRDELMTLLALEKEKNDPDEAISFLENFLFERPASIPINSTLGSIYKSQANHGKSIQYFSLACALGGASACSEAGDIFTQQGEIERSILLYEVACDLNSGGGCLKAGLMIERSSQPEKAQDFFDRSCNQYHDNVGCYHLARNLQRKNAPNHSIAPYLSKACKLFSSACKLASVYKSSNRQPEIPLEPK